MPPAFNLADYEAGHEAMRAAIVQGLSRLPPDHHAGSFTIGAFCALVRLIWDRRDPGASLERVTAYLATIASDVVREAAGRPTPQTPLQAMIEGLEAAAMCCAPRTAEGRVIKDRELTLTALAAVAADILAEEPEDAQRSDGVTRYFALVSDIVRAAGETPAPKPFRPQVINGGRA